MCNQCTVNEASLQPCQQNTLCDGCRKTGETFVKAESPVAAELLVRPKCVECVEVPDRGCHTYPCKTEA